MVRFNIRFSFDGGNKPASSNAAPSFSLCRDVPVDGGEVAGNVAGNVAVTRSTLGRLTTRAAALPPVFFRTSAIRLLTPDALMFRIISVIDFRFG